MRHSSLSTVVGCCVVAGSCVLTPPRLNDPTAPTSFRIRFADGFEPGTPSSRRPFSLTPEALPITVEALSEDGTRATSYSGWVNLRLDPGEVVSLGMDDATRTVADFVELRDGLAEGVSLNSRKAFSDARVWAQDLGYVPSDPATASCLNGVDDDSDGKIDFPEDSGCRFANDNTETEGSNAVGVSDVIYFANPHLADAQGRQSASPLDGRRVVIDEGFMTVTRITTDGFYVTEVAEDGSAVPWGSLFVFTFNTPPLLQPCDRITTLTGSVVEFFGFTELNQPSWGAEWWCPLTGECPLSRVYPTGEPSECPIPDATVLNGGVLGTGLMEQHESSVVRLVNPTFPSVFGSEPYGMGGSNCDFDGDGNVNLSNGSPEDTCNDACNMDANCSEWNQYVEFGQIAVKINDCAELDETACTALGWCSWDAETTTCGGTNHAINLLMRDTVYDFDALEHIGQTFVSITGTLRNFSPLGLERGYIVEPRCPGDVIETGTPLRANEICVAPRSGGTDEPN